MRADLMTCIECSVQNCGLRIDAVVQRPGDEESRFCASGVELGHDRCFIVVWPVVEGQSDGVWFGTFGDDCLL